MEANEEQRAKQRCLSACMLLEAAKDYIKAFTRDGRYEGEPWVLGAYGQLEAFVRKESIEARRQSP
ncbi:MAG: hypothetical protein QXF55_00625 [Candidatus Aenigmatarchaeota archaeon]